MSVLPKSMGDQRTLLSGLTIMGKTKKDGKKKNVPKEENQRVGKNYIHDCCVLGRVQNFSASKVKFAFFAQLQQSNPSDAKTGIKLLLGLVAVSGRALEQ